MEPAFQKQPECLYEYCNQELVINKPGLSNPATGDFFCSKIHLYMYSFRNRQNSPIQSCICGKIDSQDDPLETDSQTGIKLCYPCENICSICKDVVEKEGEKCFCLECFRMDLLPIICFKPECRKKHEHKLVECNVCYNHLFKNDYTLCKICEEYFCDLDCLRDHILQEISQVAQNGYRSDRHNSLICNNKKCRNGKLMNIEIDLLRCQNNCCSYCDYICAMENSGCSECGCVNSKLIDKKCAICRRKNSNKEIEIITCSCSEVFDSFDEYVEEKMKYC